MPTYQYTCTECGEPVEAVQKFTDAPLIVCAACGGRLRKVFSPVGIVFKGSGFYRNDSRKSSVSAAVADKPSGDSSAKTPSTESASSNGNGSNGNGSADKPATKKSEPAGAAAKSSSSSEKVA